MTKGKFQKPKRWLTTPLCENTYNIFRENLEIVLPHSEPLPPFESRYRDRLESILGSVQLKSEKLSYDVVQTAVAYYVHLARSQAFYNGNKRMSIVLTGTFLMINELRLAVPYIDFADLTLLVSEDRSVSFEVMIATLTPVFRDFVVSM